MEGVAFERNPPKSSRQTVIGSGSEHVAEVAADELRRILAQRHAGVQVHMRDAKSPPVHQFADERPKRRVVDEILKALLAQPMLLELLDDLVARRANLRPNHAMRDGESEQTRAHDHAVADRRRQDNGLGNQVLHPRPCERHDREQR